MERAILHSDMNCFDTSIAKRCGVKKIPDDGRNLVRMPGLMYS